MSTQVLTLFTSISSFGSVSGALCEKTSATWAKVLPGISPPGRLLAERVDDSGVRATPLRWSHVRRPSNGS